MPRSVFQYQSTAEPVLPQPKPPPSGGSAPPRVSVFQYQSIFEPVLVPVPVSSTWFPSYPDQVNRPGKANRQEIIDPPSGGVGFEQWNPVVSDPNFLWQQRSTDTARIIRFEAAGGAETLDKWNFSLPQPRILPGKAARGWFSISVDENEEIAGVDSWGPVYEGFARGPIPPTPADYSRPVEPPAIPAVPGIDSWAPTYPDSTRGETWRGQAVLFSPATVIPTPAAPAVDGWVFPPQQVHVSPVFSSSGAVILRIEPLIVSSAGSVEFYLGWPNIVVDFEKEGDRGGAEF